MRYGFEDLRLNRIWCGYFEGNEKSKRVQDKCGFQYHHTAYNVPCAIKRCSKNRTYNMPFQRRMAISTIISKMKKPFASVPMPVSISAKAKGFYYKG